jgi:hypothetical protein
MSNTKFFSKENGESKLKGIREVEQEGKSFPLRYTETRREVIQQVEKKKGEEHKNIEAERPLLRKIISRQKALIASIALCTLGGLVIMTGAVITLKTSADIGFNLMSAGALTIMAGSILWAVAINKEKKTTQQKIG